MGLDFELADGQTPLDDEEKDGLLISSITTHSELDEFEQLNIEKAIKWSLTRKFRKDELLTEKFVKQIHKKMYSDVWTWAGEFRKTKNIWAASRAVVTRQSSSARQPMRSAGLAQTYHSIPAAFTILSIKFLILE